MIIIKITITIISVIINNNTKIIIIIILETKIIIKTLNCTELKINLEK